MKRDQASTPPPSRLPQAASAPELDDAFFALIAALTGLAIRAKDREVVARALKARQSACRLSGAAYLALLGDKSAQSYAEWRLLTPALTNGESYFWRDRGQFALLRRLILPELAARRPHELRIWSAGCSTGEEVYSLALLCCELFPDNRPAVRIIGTDLNEAALERARRGCYGHWSFRGVETHLQERYFTQQDDKLWRVNDELRSLVSFRQFNLCAPLDEALRDFDLIVCRNVLIYLAPAAIDQIVAMFGAALRDGGTLMTGHAELANRDLRGLVPRSLPESLVYQKAAPALSLNPTFNPTPARAPATPPATPPAALKTAPVRRAAPRSETVKVPATPPIAAVESSANSLAVARDAADAGDHARALEACRAVIALSPFDAEAYLLWARIEIERGETAHAKVLLKKVIYLAPDQAAGFLELAALYGAENDGTRAEKMRAIVKGLSKDRGDKT